MRKQFDVNGRDKAARKFLSIIFFFSLVLPSLVPSPTLEAQTQQGYPKKRSLLNLFQPQKTVNSSRQAVEAIPYRSGQPWYSLSSYSWESNCKQEPDPDPWGDWKFLIDIDASYDPEFFRIWSFDDKIATVFQSNLPMGVDLDSEHPALCVGWTEFVHLGWDNIKNHLFVWIDNPSPPDPTPTPPPMPPSPLPTPTPLPQPSTDNATFISDITIPDGTVVSPGQMLVKTWRMQNTGSTAWGSGYHLVFVGGDRLGAPSAVNLPGTVASGASVNLSANMIAPSSPGHYVGYWRLRNSQGSYFGDRLFVDIYVGSSNSHIVAFTADPPSPSDTSSVRIHVRVDGFVNFRSARLKIDGNIVYELGAPEFSYDWDTSGYEAGDHSIVVEVADQTDTSWSRPEQRGMIYALQGTSGSPNHAPDRPSLISPYDWLVYYSGNTARLCAQANGDPDGDVIPSYYFEIYESPQLWNSGWVASSCADTSALGPYTYKWRVKVRDSHGAESAWSDDWHFTLVNPNLSITELYFEPQDANSEQVKIRACTAGQGGVGITMRVDVNDASDGSANGEWHRIKELGVPCFNDQDAPLWNTLAYGDGPHLVRVEAHGADASWDGAAAREAVYHLPHRRPDDSHLLAPAPPSENIREAVYLNSRTFGFKWEETLRTTNYTLHINTSPSPKDAASPVFRQTFGNQTNAYTVTLDQDYPELYWQISTTNDRGTNASGDQLFGIDRVAPNCAVQPLPATTFENVFQVSWGGTDNLSGIRTFDIQYLDTDRGAWSDWLVGIDATKTYDLFTGQRGHTYSFRCRATDEANNTGSYPAAGDTSIKIDSESPPTAPWWDDAYGKKRNITILNNMPGTTLPTSYPVHLRFDSGTSPTAAELYNASQSTPKCNDLRIIFNDTTELDRVVRDCSASAIDIWFRTQVAVPGSASNNTAHQLYYVNLDAGSPPGSPSTVFDPPADTATIGLWYMHEGGGSTLYDSSGHNHNCSIDSTTTWITPAKFSSALHFLGGGDGPTVNCGTASAFNLQTFTFETYLKRTGSAWGRIAGHLGNGQNRWLMTLTDNGKIRVSIWPCSTCGSEEFTSNTAIGDTVNWHHVAFTLQNSTVRIYINGQLDFTGHVVWGNIRSGTPPLTIGSAENIQRAFIEVAHARLSNIARTSFPYGSFSTITNEPVTAAGTPIDPPVAGSPDLTILSMDTYPNPSGGILVQAIIKNQGNLDTRNGFFTDVYLDHIPTGAGDYTGSVQFWVNDPISVGSVVTLTTVISDLTDFQATRLANRDVGTEVNGTIYAQVDSTGSVNETDNLNNIYTTGTEICVASPDDYEGDDTFTTANAIILDQTQTHNFGKPGDLDWLELAAQGGVSYRIETLNLDSSSDTYLYLYDTDGTTLLFSNDDYAGSLASHIEWEAPATGTFYVLVKHWNPNACGCGTSYDLKITKVLTNKVYLPAVLKDY